MRVFGYRINQSVRGISPMIVVSLLLVSTLMAQEPSSDVEAKELIKQWVATERLLGEEMNDWREEKAHVSELLGLYTKELKLLDEELAKAGKSVEEVDKRKAELEAKVSDGIQTRKNLKSFLLKLVPRVLVVEKRFPEALKLQVEPAIDALKHINDETSVREVLQSVVNVVEQANTFNSSIYQSSESVTIGSETWNAEVLYLGLGRAYFYVGSKAGVGSPGADGWKWERNDKILAEVKKAVQVFKKEKQPQLVELPVKVQP